MLVKCRLKLLSRFKCYYFLIWKWWLTFELLGYCDVVVFFLWLWMQNEKQQIRPISCLLPVFLNVSGEFENLSCEHAEAETVLKCVKHLKLIFIPGEWIARYCLYRHILQSLCCDNWLRNWDMGNWISAYLST